MIRFVEYLYAIGVDDTEEIWCDEHELSVLDTDWEEHLMKEHKSITDRVRDWVATHVGMDDPDPEPATPPKDSVRVVLHAGERVIAAKDLNILGQEKQ